MKLETRVQEQWQQHGYNSNDKISSRAAKTKTKEVMTTIMTAVNTTPTMTAILARTIKAYEQ